MEPEEATVALSEHFADLRDPQTWRSPHGLMESLLIATGAALKGADISAAVALWVTGQAGVVPAVLAVYQRCGVP